MNFLLDTTVLIDTLRSRNGRRALLAELVGQGHRLGTGAINIAEVYTGMRPGEEARTEAFLNSLQCYPMTCGIARLAGSLKGPIYAGRRHARSAGHHHCGDGVGARTYADD